MKFSPFLGSFLNPGKIWGRARVPCARVWCGLWLCVIPGNTPLDGCTGLKANYWEELSPLKYGVRDSKSELQFKRKNYN